MTLSRGLAGCYGRCPAVPEDIAIKNIPFGWLGMIKVGSTRMLRGNSS